MQSLRRRLLLMLIVAAVMSGNTWPQSGVETFPARPVTLVIPVAAGGPVDAEMHLYAPRLRDALGQPFVMEYKLGAGGTVAGAYVAKAAPDGYTLLVVNGSFTTFSSLYKALTFDTLRDFAPVTMTSRREQLLLTSSAFPIKTYAEYIAYARNNPGKINVGTAGAGSSTHLAGAWLHGATGTRVTFVHYKGTGPLLPDLIAGRLDATVAAAAAVMPQVRSGKMLALASMGNRRTNLLPELATVAEQGVAGFNYAGYTGILAPAATPGVVISKLNEAFVSAIRASEVASRLAADGIIAVANTPAQFRLQMVAETAVWRKVVQDNGIKLED